MSKYYTEAEKDKLWAKVRAVLVEHKHMKPDGSPVEGSENVCKKFRKLILVDITTKG